MKRGLLNKKEKNNERMEVRKEQKTINDFFREQRGNGEDYPFKESWMGAKIMG